MLLRNLLLIVGALCLLGGAALSVIWFNQIGSTSVEQSQQSPIARPAILISTRAIPAGTLLRPDDVGWRDADPGEIRAGSLVRGQISEADFIGAVTRREFGAGEPLVASELVKPGDRQFLAAALKPGTRAVSIAVDVTQSSGGLILPGDRVDVILTQTFGTTPDNPVAQTAAETILRNLRVIAVDQSINAQTRPSALPVGALSIDLRVPKTVTFETNELEAEQIFVGAQLGRLQLALRPLELLPAGAPTVADTRGPTWASSVSPALRDMTQRLQPSKSTIENSIRRPPAAYQ
jgi:pilus assembly protein CpaB